MPLIGQRLPSPACSSASEAWPALLLSALILFACFPPAPVVTKGLDVVASSQQTWLHSSLPSLVSLLVHRTLPVQM